MSPRLFFLLPAAWLLTVAATASSTATATPNSPSPTPPPTPTPSVGQVSLDPALGPPGGKITVSGSSFRSGEPITIYWDSADKGLGTAAADAQGAFKVDVTAPAGDPDSTHNICVDEKNPGPRCANFVLTAAAPTPSPTPVATPVPTAVPSAGGASPAPTQAATPVPLPSTQQVSAVSVLLEPPFVFFPVLLLLAALAGSGYWIWSGTRVARRAPVPVATVVHRSAHPPGTDPEVPPAVVTAETVVPTGSGLAGATSPEGEAGGHMRPLRPLSGDEPLDLPQPGD